MKEALRCAVVDCKLPPMAGQILCSDHKVKPLTLGERIAAGPKFEHVKANAVCVACRELADFDRPTGLCRPCWRAWRWSSIREYEQP